MPGPERVGGRPDRHGVLGGAEHERSDEDGGGHDRQPSHSRGSRQPGAETRLAAGVSSVDPEIHEPIMTRSGLRGSPPPQAVDGLGGRWFTRATMAPWLPRSRFLTLADVAEVLSTSSAQVYALVRRGELPAIKIGGRGQWRVEATQLEAYIDRMYDEARAFVDAHPSPRATRRPGRPPSEPRGPARQPTCEPERDPQAHLRAPALHRERERVSRLVGADRHDQRDPVGHLLAARPR